MTKLALSWCKWPVECIKIFKKVGLLNYASKHIIPVYKIYKYAIEEYQICTFAFILYTSFFEPVFRPIFSSISKIFFLNQCKTTIVHY